MVFSELDYINKAFVLYNLQPNNSDVNNIFRSVYILC